MEALYDPEVLALPAEDLTSLATEALNGALSTLHDAGFVAHLQVHGRLSSRKEHFMVGNSHGLLAGDTATALLASLQVQLDQQSQGIGYGVATHLREAVAVLDQ